jgi:hypothetical protein
LVLTEPEDSRESHIELPRSGSGNIDPSEISKSTGRRQGKRSRVQILRIGTLRFVLVDVGQNLIGPLIRDIAELAVGTARDAEEGIGRPIGEVIAVKSPASMAAVGMYDFVSAGSLRKTVP